MAPRDVCFAECLLVQSRRMWEAYRAAFRSCAYVEPALDQTEGHPRHKSKRPISSTLIVCLDQLNTAERALTCRSTFRFPVT